MAELWQTLIDNSGAIVTGFSGILAVTTIWYVVVSMKLLKQSKNVFLADIILRVMGTYRKEIEKIERREIEREDLERTVAFIKAGLKGYHETFMKIDKRLGVDIGKLFKVYTEAMVKEWNKLIEEEKEDQERPKN